MRLLVDIFHRHLLFMLRALVLANHFVRPHRQGERFSRPINERTGPGGFDSFRPRADERLVSVGGWKAAPPVAFIARLPTDPSPRPSPQGHWSLHEIVDVCKAKGRCRLRRTVGPNLVVEAGCVGHGI